jgi:Leucine-rich repeat (LRR) protein
MKKLLLILLCLPLIGFSQLTYVPDDNFEQALINLGYDNVLDDYVMMSSIDTVISLLVFNQNISDLTGIEDFVNLQLLRCSGNQLTNLDVSNNSSLSRLFCGGNQITNLNLQNNLSLMILRCGNNPLTSLDLSNNNLLIKLFCRNSLLTNLNIKNGNTISLDSLMITTNPNLYCIEVNNINYANNNWTFSNGSIDNQHYFSTNCSGTAIEEHTTNKELLRTIDVLGRETKNKPLFYIYDDGTVEKRITIE